MSCAQVVHFLFNMKEQPHINNKKISKTKLAVLLFYHQNRNNPNMIYVNFERNTLNNFSCFCFVLYKISQKQLHFISTIKFKRKQKLRELISNYRLYNIGLRCSTWKASVEFKWNFIFYCTDTVRYLAFLVFVLLFEKYLLLVYFCVLFSAHLCILLNLIEDMHVLQLSHNIKYFLR